MKALKHLLPVVLLWATVALAPAAFADSTANFNVSGTYGADAPSLPLSTPGADFAFQFTLPTNLGPQGDYVLGDDFYVYTIPVNYSLNGAAWMAEPALVAFYSANAISQSGGFFIDICATDPSCATGLEYQWTFAGPVQYTGSEANPILVPQDFGFSLQSFNVWQDTYTEMSGSINGGVTTAVVTTPEPAASALLFAGVGLLAALALKRK